MKNKYLRLDWDTNFFGFGVARLVQEDMNAEELLSTLNELRGEKYRLVYWNVPCEKPTMMRLAINHGAFHADEKLTYSKKLDRECDQLINYDYGISSCLGAELDHSMIELALQSSEYSRFRFDPKFPAILCDKMYAHWIAQSVNGVIAREVLVAREGNEISGLITLGGEGECANIGLIAVAETARGKGVGKALVGTATRQLLEGGYKCCQVVTQHRNTGACRFYESCGYEIMTCENVFHFWL